MSNGANYSKLIMDLQDANVPHWLVDEDIPLADCDELLELIQTGSVTTTIDGKEYTLWLEVKEVEKPEYFDPTHPKAFGGQA